MLLLHTSDWHLGASLYGFSRLNEQKLFLDWLLTQIKLYKVEALLVSGDIFDSATPSNAAKALYSDFLSALPENGCRYALLTGGNHDSPSWLNADASLLKIIGASVIGQAPERIEDEVFVLKDNNGEAAAVICAVPYLRERDLHNLTFGQTIEERDRQIAEGISSHYANAARRALALAEDGGRRLPVIAMGHLAVCGAERSDSETTLMIGTLGALDSKIFSPEFDYVALGHIHTPQKVSGSDFLRYCGSPLKMSFSEKNNKKQVLLLNVSAGAEGKRCAVTEIAVPQSRELISISGLEEGLKKQAVKAATENPGALIEVIYTGSERRNDLREILSEELKSQFKGELSVEILRIRHMPDSQTREKKIQTVPDIKNINELEMFELVLKDSTDVPEESREELSRMYTEILKQIREEDSSSEEQDTEIR